MQNPLILVLVSVIMMIVAIIIMKVWTEKRIRDMELELSNQTGDVWNISGRVPHERPVTSEPSSRWPTHDNHISIDTFVIPEHFQPYKIDKIPPPPYCEVDLPTYEQATINPKDTVIPTVHVTPSSSRVEN